MFLIDCFFSVELHILKQVTTFFTRLEKEILDRYLDVVLKGNKDGLKVICTKLYFYGPTELQGC
jgi:hypothetical protein